MKEISKEELDNILKLHKMYLNNEDGGVRADLRRADLQYADLRDADLQYSCLPIWCGSLSAHFDDKQLTQIAYHLVKAGLNSKNASEETKEELKKIVDFANKFHRVDECGVIEIGGECK